MYKSLWISCYHRNLTALDQASVIFSYMTVRAAELVYWVVYRPLYLALATSYKTSLSLVLSGNGSQAPLTLPGTNRSLTLLRRNCFQMGAEIEEGLHCCHVRRLYFWHRRAFRFVRFNIREHSSPVSTKLSRQNAARRSLKALEGKTDSGAVLHSELQSGHSGRLRAPWWLPCFLWRISTRFECRPI